MFAYKSGEGIRLWMLHRVPELYVKRATYAYCRYIKDDKYNTSGEVVNCLIEMVRKVNDSSKFVKLMLEREAPWILDRKTMMPPSAATLRQALRYDLHGFGRLREAFTRHL